jgi:DNA-binding LacI/PurR family transcriptional regulator
MEGERMTDSAPTYSRSQASPSRLLALIVPTFANSFYNAVALAAERAAHLYGYTLLLGVTGEDYLHELEVVNQLMVHRVAGYIVAPVNVNSVAVESIRRINAPLVVVERLVPQQAHQLGIDHHDLINQSVRHLVANGHRRIGFITSSSKIPSITYRNEAFKEAITACGIDAAEVMVISIPRTFDAGLQAVKKALLQTPLTAILVGGSVIARGAVAALRESHFRIPDQISVLIYSNPEDWFIYSYPSFSYADLPGSEMGEKAVKLLIQQIERNAPPPETVLLRGELNYRESVKDLTKA